MIEAQPSRTALRVALRRAAHQIHDALPRVLDDPLAVPILGPEAREELSRTPDSVRRPFSAGLRAFMVVRARLAEDVLAGAVKESGARQYLVLGAGLDTFAYRNPHAQVRVFEVDHPATQAWKQERLSAAHIQLPATMRFVAVDFERQSLREELAAAGFDFNLLTVTAWLGVVPYLTPEAFRGTIALLGSLARGSDVVFDYSQPREVLSHNEQLMLDSMAARVAQAGEPFQLFFRPEELAAELAHAGMAVIEDMDGPALHNRYLAERSDGLALRGRAGRLCHARTL
ncbi:methyltransferase, TIGR00027 family [Bryocella elongata]|uniref:S-adenosyl-L-methionine-dependent methyltransferase n=1 Tax=Bryocella elongata TaxID=863522 RepID=A0A1H5Y365_9BACT|nr:class I SAM-dependent methyltransferase [Bryocella elongata]SEG17996.1 methyltransferase, TIGR00027 family [Bryocella elongata]